MIFCYFCLYLFCHIVNYGKKAQNINSNGNIHDVSHAAKPSATVPKHYVSIRSGMRRGNADSDIASPVAREVGDVTWCTNVNLDGIAQQLRDFLQNFFDDNTLFIYPEIIEDEIESKEWCLSVNSSNLYTCIVKFKKNWTRGFAKKIGQCRFEFYLVKSFEIKYSFVDLICSHYSAIY